MAFTAKDVQTLREKTACGMMDCKKALTEADGNMERATELLREKGLSAAAKKAGRIAAEGIVQAITDDVKKVAAIVEVNSETDFVGKNADFIAFVNAIAETIIALDPPDLDALAASKLAGSNMTVEEALRDKILVIGENLKIRRFARHQGAVATYIHGGGRIGVLVRFDTSEAIAAKPEFKSFAKDVAMHVAAVNPLYTTKDEVPPEVLAKEKEILTAQAINEGKPANIAEKMVQGRISKYYKEFCLNEQIYVKNNDLTISQFVEGVGKELGGPIKLTGFVRFEKGEGIEKREDNFADEVAGMIK